MTIAEYEEKIEEKRELFLTELSNFIAFEHNATDDVVAIQLQLNKVHNKAVAFFTKFEKSISLYEGANFKAGKNIQLAKVNSTKSLLELILYYWKVIHSNYKPINGLQTPEPNSSAYADMQGFLRSFDPVGAKQLETKFVEAGLPTAGFKSKKTYNPLNIINMTKNQQIKFGLYAGFCLLIALIVLVLIFECPTESVSWMFSVIMALAGAAFSMSITGKLNLKYNAAITASGALAVLVMLYFFKPVGISTFQSCQKDLSGTVYYGDNTEQDVQVKVQGADFNSESNSNGNFTIKNIDLSALSDTISFRIRKPTIQLDTVIPMAKLDANTSFSLRATKHCITCIEKDSLGKELERTTQCSASRKHLKDLEFEGVKKAQESKLTLSCKIE